MPALVEFISNFSYFDSIVADTNQGEESYRSGWSGDHTAVKWVADTSQGETRVTNSR